MYTRPLNLLARVKYLCTIAVCLMGPLQHMGQELPFTHYTQESEIMQLPSAEVQSSYQDQYGYLWFAVYSSGLIRYNGNETVLFTETDGLPTLTVYEVIEDALGRLWVSTDAGIAVSEKPLQDYLLNERPRFNNMIDSIPLANIAVVHNRMISDSLGSIWIGTEENGIIKYSFESLSDLTVDTIKTDYGNNHQNRRVRALISRQDGTVWVSLEDGDVEFFPPGKTEGILFTDADTAPCQTEVLFETSSGQLWGGCWNGTLWKLNQANIEVISTEISNRLIAIKQDLQGTIWVASYGSGVLRIDEQQSITRLNQQNGFLSNNINDIFLDGENNLWFSQSGGISKLRSNHGAFLSYTESMTLNGRPIFANPSLNAVLRSGRHSGLIWAATTGAGVTSITSEGNSQSIRKNHGLLSDRVTSLLEDKEGRLWIGSSEGINCLSVLDAAPPPPGLYQQTISFLGQPATMTTYDDHSIYSATKISLPVNDLGSATVESLWFPGYQHLYCLVEEQWYIFRSGAGLPSTYFHAIAGNSQGKLWVGTRDRGLFSSRDRLTLADLEQKASRPHYFPGSTEVMGQEIVEEVFQSTWNESMGSLSDNVESLLVVENVIWMGTTKGLSALEGQPVKNVATLSKEEGLAANNITSMDYSTATNTIWVGTNGGLAEIDPETKTVLRRITKQNGLVDNEVWYYGSVFIDEQGQVLYGTAKGLTIYNPALDAQVTHAPLLNLEKAEFSEGSTGNNEISFQYAALSYIAERNLRYQTRLQGFDEEWSEITEENKIRYTNLPAFLIPRKYTFQVLAGYHEGAWTETPLEYSFSVKPAWWLRWWSFLIQALIAGGLLFGYIRYKTKRQALALEKQKEVSRRLIQIDKLKDQFLANTSHELRTPLNGIIGLTESLIGQEKNPKIKQDLSMIYSSGKRLASLVNDILDFSKIQNEDLALQLAAVDLKATVEVVLNLSQILVQGKNVELTNEVPENLPAVMADENRLFQILHNLVGNAIKFTQNGFVKISAALEGEFVRISVVDSGIGIPEDKIKVIFESFKQADGETAREYGGTGLGLSITKQLIELHGGSIGVSSNPGEGSEFYFTLPLASGGKKAAKSARTSTPSTVIEFDGNGVSEDEPTTDLELADLSGEFKILIVDDEPVNRKVLWNHLTAEGYQILQAPNGGKALKIIEDNGQKIDLVLLDVMMPKMSGFEVCQKMRERYMANELPILMLTAKDQVTDLIQGLAAGANDYITKPFTKSELLARIKTHLNLAKINFAYGRFVPREFLKSIGRQSILDVKLGDQVQGEVTVFFSDIRSYSSLSETMTPEENFNFLNAYLSRVAPLIRKHGGFVNQFLGDGIMALFLGNPKDAVMASIGIQKAVSEYNVKRIRDGYKEIQVGIGLHTGPLMLGIIGDGERMDAGVVSDTVNTAARMEGLTKHYGASIIISKPTLDGIEDKSDLNYRGLGLVQVKGKNQALKIYEFYDGDQEQTVKLKQELQPIFETALNDYFNKDFTHAATAFQEVLSKLPGDKAATLYLKRSAQFMVNGVSEDWSGIETMTEK